MSQDGYDVEVIGEVPSDFYCVICLKPMQNALWTWYVQCMLSKAYQVIQRKVCTK